MGVCESALWTVWVNVGAAEAKTECKVVALEVVQFAEVMKKDGHAWQMISDYASAFVAWLNDCNREDLIDFAKADEIKDKLEEFVAATIPKEEEAAEIGDGVKSAGSTTRLSFKGLA